jgi:hypothetical protein
MGYSTDFTPVNGGFTLDKPLKPEHKAYLEAFNRTRRMGRDVEVTKTLPDPLREAAGLPLGGDGEFYVGVDDGNFGQKQTPDITDYNNPPVSQPGLWCGWVPNRDGTAIEWDGGEKFYSYTQWMFYLISNFLEPWGYTVNGEVEWQGEDSTDFGRIRVKDNVVSTAEGKKTYGAFTEV